MDPELERALADLTAALEGDRDWTAVTDAWLEVRLASTNADLAAAAEFLGEALRLRDAEAMCSTVRRLLERGEAR